MLRVRKRLFCERVRAFHSLYFPVTTRLQVSLMVPELQPCAQHLPSCLLLDRTLCYQWSVSAPAVPHTWSGGQQIVFGLMKWSNTSFRSNSWWFTKKRLAKYDILLNNLIFSNAVNYLLTAKREEENSTARHRHKLQRLIPSLTAPKLS